MSKKTKITDDDLKLFRHAVSGTKPLVQKKIRLAPPASHLKKAKKPTQTKLISLDEDQDIAPVRSEEFIFYKHHSISNKTLRKLRKGQYNVEAKLDLHGITAEEAKYALESFLHHALNLGQRVILIIHGKGRHTGMPILKSKINHWLRQLPVVLAFCSADSSHGSRGAIYVLLKRNSELTL